MVQLKLSGSASASLTTTTTLRLRGLTGGLLAVLTFGVVTIEITTIGWVSGTL